MTEADDATRRNWAQLPESEKNVFLHHMAHALIETGRAKIWPAHVAAASQWTAGKIIAKETLGGALWRPHVLWIAAVAGAVGIFFVGWGCPVAC